MANDTYEYVVSDGTDADWIDCDEVFSDTVASISRIVCTDYGLSQWEIEEEIGKWVRKMRCIDKKHLKNRNRRITSKAWYSQLVKLT